MNDIHTETLIIGAGPAGMACAMELSKKKKGFLVIEQDISVGGLSKTYKFEEKDGSVFYSDNGPHRFFSKNPYLYEFIGDILKQDWIKVKRHTQQYIDGKFYDYPINALQALKNIGFAASVRMLFDYAAAKVRYGILKKPVTTFEDYVVANFGRTLGEFNMINYTEKVWGIPARQIHPDWAKQRIKGLDLKTIIKDMLARMLRSDRAKPKSLVDEFYYPRKGTGQIYESIKSKLEDLGYGVLVNTAPLKIEKKNGEFHTTILNKEGERSIVRSKYLVESVPILEFMNLLGESHSENISRAISKLRYRSQVYLFVTINKASLTDDQWIYFPSKDIPIARVSEMKNFSPYMSPAGKTSLFIEFFCFEGDETWNMTASQALEAALPHCEAAGLFSRRDVRERYIIKKKNVYPIYDLNYTEYLDVLKEYLNGIQNLFFIGRPGRFRYNNQDHSLEMGIMAARSIIDGKNYDMESTGEEKEYFEQGEIYDKQTPKNE